jgi:hypothetical protein
MPRWSQAAQARHGGTVGAMAPEDELADRPLTQPHPDRLDPAHPRYGEILAAHAAALAAEQAGYIDPGSGLFVMTAAELADRGTCCEQGCRHCPYLR